MEPASTSRASSPQSSLPGPSQIVASPDKHARDGDSVERGAKRAKTAHDAPSPLPSAAKLPVSRVGSVDVKIEVETEAGSRVATPSASRHASPQPDKLKKKAASKAPLSASSSASAKKLPKPKEVKKPIVDKKKAKPKSRTLDELKSERARSTSTQPTTPGLDVESEDAYCICKGAVEEEEGGTMIGCEVCDNWFHPSCAGVAENEVDLLDVFICKDCEGKTSRRTVYKTLCKREGCDRKARATSKFCSSRCAFQHAQGVLSTVDNKKARTQIQSALAAYPSPTPTVTVEHHGGTAVPAPAPGDGAESLVRELKQQSEGVTRALELVGKRRAILEQAVAYYDSLVVTLVPAAPAPASKKSKNKRRDGQKEERPCAFDPRLLWDDDEVGAWAGDEAPLEDAPEEVEPEAGAEEDGADTATPKPPSRAVCKNGRRCDRHQGWQRTTGVALDVEVAQLTRRRDELAAYADGIEREAELDAAAAKARDEVHRRLKA
ncbi:60S ribosomal subunit assembly or modification protein [Vanrija albida]|uniref:60S ribosomal subunit assembly or modification protein n=1 Tax=Vanrija albida TaxID=181172 RepID=A0ABR3Q394_9TREE